MAWSTLFISPATLPPLGTRGYLQTDIQGIPILKRKRKHHRRPTTTQDPEALFLWGGPLAPVQRSWQAIITKWWKSGNTGIPKSQWNALAAANPITTYKGTTKITTGLGWFIQYQKRSLNAHELMTQKPNPAPTYEIPPVGGTHYTYPDYPRGAWTPPPNVSAVTLVGSYNGQITLNFVIPNSSDWLTLFGFFSLKVPGNPPTKTPHYQEFINSWYFPPNSGGPQTFAMFTSQLHWPWRYPSRATVGLAIFDEISRSYSPILWTPIDQST